MEPDEQKNLPKCHIWSWLQQVSRCLLEEQEALKLCRELVKNNLVTID